MLLSEKLLSDLFDHKELKARLEETEKTAAWLRAMMRATELTAEMDFLPDPRPNLFQQLHQALVTDKFPSIRFPVGTVFPDVWTGNDNFTNFAPLRLVSYEWKLRSDGQKHLGAVLMREYLSWYTVTFDEHEPGAPNRRDAYGYNRYLQSAIHQWLNSDQPASKWWQPQHEHDRPPQVNYDIPGYLRGCSPELLEVVGAFQLEMPAVDDDGVTFRDKAECKFFLPSPEELGIRLDGQYDDPPEVWQYFEGSYRYRNTMDENPRHVFVDNYGKPMISYLRSADLGTSTQVWGLYPNGKLARFDCINTFKTTPACIVF